MHLAAKWIIVFLVSCAFVCARAGASWEGSLSCKNALTKGKVTTDVAFALIGSWEPFTVQGTWKADEKGFASFRLTEELELASSVDLRGELLRCCCPQAERHPGRGLESILRWYYL
jgi:hypothetical protein